MTTTNTTERSESVEYWIMNAGTRLFKVGTGDTPPVITFMGRHKSKGCKVQWGPRCRVMKRTPKGQENVSMKCRCGEYLEVFPVQA